jgi:hypothetical protein
MKETVHEGKPATVKPRTVSNILVENVNSITNEAGKPLQALDVNQGSSNTKACTTHSLLSSQLSTLESLTEIDSCVHDTTQIPSPEDRLVLPCSRLWASCKYNHIGAQIFLICLFLFSACFGQLCAHQQEKIPYLCDTWYLSLCTDDCLVCTAE